MASTISSLFGPSAEQIVYDRQKEERDRKDLQYQQTLLGLRDTPGAATGYALGYQSGQGLSSAVRGFQSGEGTQGKILGGLFGKSEQLEDPRLAKALQMRQAFEGMTAADLKDPDKLQEVMDKLQASGNTEAAFQVGNMVTSARDASRQTMSQTGVLFEHQGQLIRGGYNEYGQAVGIDQQGNQFTLPADAIEVQKGTAPTPDEFEIKLGENFGKELGLDDYEIQVVNAEAKAVQNMPGNQNLTYPTALRIAYLRKGVLDTTNNTSLGLSRPANREAGESAYLQPDGKGGFTVVIANASGQIVVTGRTMSADEAARNGRRVNPPKAPVKRTVEVDTERLPAEPTEKDLLTGTQVYF